MSQRKIAAILSAYDDLIENNRRRIKILEEMAQRIYREWFVDFRYPGHEAMPLVESETRARPARLGGDRARHGAGTVRIDPPVELVQADRRRSRCVSGVICRSRRLSSPQRDVRANLRGSRRHR